MERITLNIIPKGITPVCHASQFDIGRVIRCDIMDDLQGYVFSDETVELRVRKPDNNVVTASVDVVSGDTFVLIETTEQMTACDGVNKCELRIMKGDIRIGSLNFDMKVEVDPLKDGIESETEIHNLETQIRELDEEIVPDIVAEEVARQYTGDVIFDDEPTENHGDGYAVNSAGLKSYIPKIIDALDDVEIDNPTSNQALVYNPTTQKWENGEVSTVGGLNDLNDVTLENVADKQELVYDDTDDVFKNKTTRVELTQAEYDALVSGGTVLPDVDYYITDAPSMQGTSADLSYDGTTLSTYDKIEEVASDVSDLADVVDTKADTSNFIDETGVTVTCPRCPIASISRDFARKSGNVLFYGTKISFGNTSESGNIYFFVNKAITNSFIMGTLYDNATDQVYSLGKNYGRDTMWLRQGDQPVSASIFQGKTEISLSLMIIL